MTRYISLEGHPSVMHEGAEHLAPKVKVASPALPVHDQTIEAVSFHSGEVTLTERAMDTLSLRQRQVSTLAISGLPNTAIARALFLDENTIRTHLQSIHQRIGTRKVAASSGTHTARRSGLLNAMLAGNDPLAKVTHRLVLPPGVSLSHGEWQTARGVMQGGTNPIIAKELDLAEPTIKTNLDRLGKKFGTGSRELIAFVGATSEEIGYMPDEQESPASPKPPVYRAGAFDPRSWYLRYPSVIGGEGTAAK